MKSTVFNSVHSAAKRKLIGLSFLLVIVSAFGCFYWKTYSSEAKTVSITPEQIYYEHLAFAANEMHNQAVKYNTLQQEGKLTRAQIDKGKSYVDSLFASLAAPPEELTVTQAITVDLYHSYDQYVRNLEADHPQQKATYELMKANYDQFLQNGELIKVLNAYSGVTIICH